MRTYLVRIMWILSIALVVTGSLLPARSPVIRALGLLPVTKKLLHFCGYTWLCVVGAHLYTA